MKSPMILVVAVLAVTPGHAQKVVKGDIEYSVATYADEVFVAGKYATFLDSLLQMPILEFLRNTDIKGLPLGDAGKAGKIRPSESHVITPLFVDMANCSGIYAKRVWPSDPRAGMPVRFKCGFFHRLFIIADEEYTELSKDTLANEKLIERLLAVTFSDAELSQLIRYCKTGFICSHYTHLPPLLIRRKDEILFDADRE